MGKLDSKADFQELLVKIVQPVKPFYSQSGALLDLGKTSAHYPDRVAMLEGFARPLWGLAPFWRGGGVENELVRVCQDGLTAGTDPDHPDYWDAAGEVNQRYVEMAAIALGLLLVPETLWEPLSDTAKENVARWLGKINTIDPSVYPDCNWWFFVILPNLALQNLGLPYRQDRVEYAFERLESFYLGNGWYRDGTGGRKDYYVSFAIHFYNLLYSELAQDSERRRVFRERAEKFAADFLYWFDDRGRAVPYGRSLTYRFAQCAFWSAYVYAGLESVPLGVAKGILSRHLRDWMSYPIFDRDSVLTIGYIYPNLNMAETYNAPGSPYWALKPFLMLALPDEHPFWRTVAEPMPELDAVKHFPDARMLIQRCEGHTVMYPDAVFRNDSFGHMPEKYGKFAYSTEFGFSVSVGFDEIELAAPDSMLAFAIDGTIYTRRNAESSVVENNQMRSVWSPVAGITVETVLIPTKNGHIRRHTVTNSLRACTAYDCGFAVHAPAPNAFTGTVQGSAASVSCGKTSCSVTSVQGGGEGHVIIAAPNTNLIHSKTALPAVQYQIPLGKTILETEITADVREEL